MQKLPIGIQAFEVLRSRGYLYVDKTQTIHQLVTEGMYYFLARPRRFGKSLLVSTLKCLFQGRRELFTGLWIAEQSDWQWQPHPVIVLDFNGIAHDSPEVLQRDLTAKLASLAAQAQVPLEGFSLVAKFGNLIQALHQQTGQPVVVLIDEYDKPLIEHLGKGPDELALAAANRDILKGFFGVLKEADVSAALRFVFLTGITQFSKVSIFSALNNLNNISMHEDYAELLGYTPAELTTYFAAYIQQLAAKFRQPATKIEALLAQHYDGYRFSEKNVHVYNPFSILQACNHKNFKDYWFETGTPTFLIHLLQQAHYPLPQAEELLVSRSIFTTFELHNLHPAAALFQTGYLTIKNVEGRLYTLGYPNQEVKTAFTESLLYAWAESVERTMSSHVLRLSRYLAQADLPAFFETIRAIFGSIPYDIGAKKDEAYFHTIFYLMISASGGAAQSSVLTSRGRIDLVVTCPDRVYIIEFKCDQSADVALRQIHAQGYPEQYRRQGKELLLLGLNFSTEERNLAMWKIERIARSR
ncbi:MAG: AAA family ATPase [Chloroflexota bacterium]|nr:AAA family ATPase [Chloroflexota bacterium]